MMMMLERDYEGCGCWPCGVSYMGIGGGSGSGGRFVLFSLAREQGW